MTAKVDDYYGFVIRRLAAQGALPAGFRRRDPSGAAAGAGQAVRPSPGDEPVPEPASAARDSASASRQTQAE